MYAAAAIVFTLSMPLAAALTSFLSRPRVLAGLLFALVIASYLSALIASGEPAATAASAMSFPVRLSWLHPLLLAEAVAFAGSIRTRAASVLEKKRGGQGALSALWLGLPFITWVCMKVPPVLAFTVGAVATALVGSALLGRESQAIDRQMVSGRRPVSPAMTVALSGFAVVAQYAAMFSMYSHSLTYLEAYAALDAETASFRMVLFGVGGIFGTTVARHFSQRHSAIIALAPPLALAAALLFLHRWASGSTLPAVLSVMLWGAAHSGSMLAIRAVWNRLNFRTTGIASAVHLASAGAGVLAGAVAAPHFAQVSGPAGIVGCALTFDATALIAVALQLGRLWWIARCDASARSIVASRATEQLPGSYLSACRKSRYFSTPACNTSPSPSKRWTLSRKPRNETLHR